MFDIFSKLLSLNKLISIFEAFLLIFLSNANKNIVVLKVLFDLKN